MADGVLAALASVLAQAPLILAAIKRPAAELEGEDKRRRVDDAPQTPFWEPEPLGDARRAPDEDPGWLELRPWTRCGGPAGASDAAALLRRAADRTWPPGCGGRARVDVEDCGVEDLRALAGAALLACSLTDLPRLVDLSALAGCATVIVVGCAALRDVSALADAARVEVADCPLVTDVSAWRGRKRAWARLAGLPLLWDVAPLAGTAEVRLDSLRATAYRRGARLRDCRGCLHWARRRDGADLTFVRGRATDADEDVVVVSGDDDDGAIVIEMSV